MNLIFKFIYLFLLIMSATLFNCNYQSQDDVIIAYPNPFNPGENTLKIAYTGSCTTIDKISIDIFDINEDRVFHGDFNSFLSPIIWNGRSSYSGDTVESGEYIIEVKGESSTTGYYVSNIITILVYAK